MKRICLFLITATLLFSCSSHLDRFTEYPNDYDQWSEDNREYNSHHFSVTYGDRDIRFHAGSGGVRFLLSDLPELNRIFKLADKYFEECKDGNVKIKKIIPNNISKYLTFTFEYDDTSPFFIRDKKMYNNPFLSIVYKNKDDVRVAVISANIDDKEKFEHYLTSYRDEFLIKIKEVHNKRNNITKNW